MSAYAVTAQFYDAVTDDAHAAVDARIAAALAGLDTILGPVVDIGAGTGLTTRTIAAALPDAAIWAIEPDPAMRPALMTRIWSDLDLRSRVSIIPTAVADAPLPPVLAGAVLGASLVHFSPPERARLWTLLAERLQPNGRVVIEVQCPEAVALPERHMSSSRVGQVIYEGWASAEIIGDDRQRWRMTYRAMMGDTELARESTTFDCWAISAERIISEAADAALAGELVDDLVILSHPASSRSGNVHSSDDG